jgi:Uma2 family endonuclease
MTFMAEAALKLATWDDLEALTGVPEGTNVEIVDGEIVLTPRSASSSGRTQGGLYYFVGGPFDFDPDGPGGWWLVIEPEVELDRHQVLIPDLAGWRRERLPRLPDSRRVRVRPDWVCEVLSPSTERLDRLRKANAYLRAGVPHYWLVSVPGRLLEALEAQGDRWVRVGAYSDGDVVRIPPFEAVELDVGRLFPPLAG